MPVVAEPHFLGMVMERASMALFSASFVYVALTVQTVRLALVREKKGAFPLTWLVCIAVLFEAFVRSGVLLHEDSIGAASVFALFKPLTEFKVLPALQDTIYFTIRVLAQEENSNNFVTRVIVFSFCMVLLVHRLYYGSGATRASANKLGVGLCTLGFGVIGAYAGRSCGPIVLGQSMEHSIVKEPHLVVLKVSQTLQMCMPGIFGLAGAFVTIALLHASLFWNKSSWLGWQHVLALRWLGAIAALLRLYLQNRLVFGPKIAVTPHFEVEAVALLVQIGLVAILFIPRFTRRQPLAFFAMFTALGLMAALSLGYIPLRAEACHRMSESLGIVSVFSAFVAVFLSGGFGIAFTVLIVGSSMRVHAPWILK